MHTAGTGLAWFGAAALPIQSEPILFKIDWNLERWTGNGIAACCKSDTLANPLAPP
jgi:hypothetical protein